MARTVEITVPSDRTDQLVAEIGKMQGLLGLQVQRGVSLKPPGDLISVSISRRSLSDLMKMLDERGVPKDPGASITTSQPLSITSSSVTATIVHDADDSTWEEIETTIARETNMTINTLILMFAAGVFAVIGLATNALHYVLAAMTIAPGFMPILRVALGVVAHSKAWRRGLADIGGEYLALIVGAAATTLVLRASGIDVFGGKSSYLPEGVLLRYWSTLTVPAVLGSLVAGFTGAVLVYTERSILTLAVMIALALITGAAMIGMGLAGGSLTVAAQGLLRWAVEVAIVLITALAVFRWKLVRLHNRKMWL
jgi:hypothetical protein